MQVCLSYGRKPKIHLNLILTLLKLHSVALIETLILLVIFALLVIYKMGQSRSLFVYFRHFLITMSIIQIEKSLDGVLGIQAHGRSMVSADKTMELRRRPFTSIFVF